MYTLNISVLSAFVYKFGPKRLRRGGGARRRGDAGGGAGDGGAGDGGDADLLRTLGGGGSAGPMPLKPRRGNTGKF